jgi:hypothetical protein
VAITILRQGQAPAAVKAQAAVPAPKLDHKLDHVVQHAASSADDTTLRESRVSHATKKDPTAAVRRARWRKKNPVKHADQQRAARARRKEKM